MEKFLQISLTTLQPALNAAVKFLTTKTNKVVSIRTKMHLQPTYNRIQPNALVCVVNRVSFCTSKFNVAVVGCMLFLSTQFLWKH